MAERSVVHVVVTRNFAGVERHVCDVSNELASRGWDVAVVGGSPSRMRAALSPRVRWLRGGSPVEAAASLARTGRQGVCHVHMTIAEAVGILARPLHRAPVVATRHFAAPRGKTRAGRALAPWISRALAREIAISEFVAERIERSPVAVVVNGVPESPVLWSEASRTVLVLQRLEPEKDTAIALRSWRASRLAAEGWSLRVVGGGSERPALERWVGEHDVPGVSFADWTADVRGELSRAAVLLAPAPAEPFGLAVLEAMAAGVPVVAAAGGGHLETAALVPGAPMFAPGDAAGGAAALRSLVETDARAAISRAARDTAASRFSIAAQVDALLEEYALA